MLPCFSAHVDDPDEGKGLAIGPFIKADKIVFPGPAVLERFKGWCRRPQHDGATFDVATNDCQVASVVARGVFLLIGVFMFLIHYDETGVGQGSENGGTGTHDYLRLALTDAVPFVEAFALGEMGVENGDLVLESCEAGFEVLHGLGRERNLGNEDKNGPALIETMLRSLQINLGFSGSGYTMEKQGFNW